MNNIWAMIHWTIHINVLTAVVVDIVVVVFGGGGVVDKKEITATKTYSS